MFCSSQKQNCFLFISTTGVSYSAAFALGEIQWSIICELDDEKVDWSKADDLIRRKLDPVRESMGVDLSTISHDTEVGDRHRSRL